MKKKFIALLLIVAVMATFTVSAAGCGIISKNEDRVAKQNMITVTYKDLTDGVTANDVYSYLISSGYYQYITNYGMSADSLLEQLGNSLAQQKLAVLAARCYFADQKGVAHDSDMSLLLRNDEYSDCIDSTNESLEKQYKTYYDDIVEKENKKTEEANENDEEEDDDFKDETLEARTTKTKSDDKDYSGADIAAAEVSKKFFDYKTAEVAGDKNKQKALNKVSKLLEDNNTGYDELLEDAMESKIVAKYKREVVEAGIADPTDAEIVAKYDEIYSRNLIAYTDQDAFETGISSGMSGSVYQPYGDYGYVLQILIKYNDDQAADIKAYKNYADEDALNAYMKNEVANIKVNVSNPDYDKDADENDCTDEGYDFANDENLTMKGIEKPDSADADALAVYNAKRLNVINQHACADANCPLKAYVELDVPVADILARIKADVDAADTTAAKIKAFESWIYKVNDDTGIFNSNGYLIVPEGRDSSYVASFTALGRELIKNGNAAAWDLTAARIAEMVDDDVDGADLIVNDGTVTYCVSEYGIHLMMVHTKGLTTAEVAAANNKLPDNFITSYLTDETTTLKESIKNSISSERKANAYSTFYQGIYKDAVDKDNFKRDDKKFDELVEKVNKAMGVA